MSDIADLERRVTSALERIGAGLDALPMAAPQFDPGEVEALKEALESERTANAQLEERVLAIKEKQDTSVAALEARVASLSAQAAQQEADLARLKQVNAQLRDSNAALRDANAEGVGDAHLINKAMLAELEGLRASRAADLGELEAIMGELKPLIEEEA